MSHFTVLVIGDDPKSQLAPYDESITVPPYKNGKVSDEDIDSFLSYYKGKGYPENGFDELYKRVGGDWNSGRWRRDGNGELWEYSTYNPNSKWDWYELGGRWSGFFSIKDPERQGMVTTANKARKGEIIDVSKKPTFAVLKNGDWFERGQMGWFAMVSNAKEDSEWETIFASLLADVSEDTWLYLYDCHI